MLFSVGGCTCSETPEPTPDPVEPDPVEVEPEAEADPFVPVAPDDERFSENPRLLKRLVSTPHGYYRFINIPFSEAVCERFGDDIRTMPTVNLHGDAHLEQYTVTDVGTGLSDFDDSSSGPAILDIIRFGASIRLAAMQHGWNDRWEAAFANFLRGYRESLRDPEQERPTTAFSERVREGFHADRERFLEWASGLMAPIEDEEGFRDGYQRYRALMLEEHEDLSRTYFDMKQAGAFRMGVGSALDEKYLVRIEGPTDEPSDDLILEYKEVRDLSGISCIQGSEGGGAFRILVSQSRIGDAPHRFLAQVPRGRRNPDGRPFWVHEWLANYKELEVQESLESADELDEIAHDTGRQLGRGHTQAIAAPLDSQLRRAQLDSLLQHEGEILAAVADLSQRSMDGWNAFRENAPAPEEIEIPE
ncbi:MAG: DUF2252 family protein [Myxococcota bacterium]